MTDLIGQILGQYQIVDQIGMGGMATVYKAYQASMDRFVAIKVLPKQLAEDPTFIGRFEQEARTIAKLENKHILPVYDYGEQAGYTYLVMRYVGSGTLKDLITQGPIPLSDVVDYLGQMADALQYAHDHGVIHRDVKSSNVLLGEGKQTYLTDFGIAKLAAGSAHFTGTGVVVGTPAYMSPEQCIGHPADARSDIYSLGVVLYEMLTGQVPFQAETPVAVVMMHVREPLPPPRTINPNLPESIEKVIFRALAKEPDHRYQTATEMSEALRDAFETFTQRQTLMVSAADLRAAAPPDFTEDETLALKESRQAAPGQATATSPSAVTAATAAAARQGSRRWLWAALAAIVIAVVIGAAVLLSGGKEKKKGGENATLEATTAAVAAQVETTPEPTAVPTPGETSPQATPTVVAQVETTPGANVEPSVPGVSAVPGLTVFTSTRGSQVQDRQLAFTPGGLWMNSPGGLTFWKRDGTSRTYTSQDGLPYNNIEAMALDASGDLWLGGGGDFREIVRVKFTPDGTITQIDSFDPSNSGLASDYAWTFLPLPDKTMLVGTYQSLIEWWAGDAWKAPTVPGTNSALAGVGDRVWSLNRTPDGSLWAGGPNGLAHLPPGATDWEMVPPADILAAENPESYTYRSFYVDPLDGAMWVSVTTMPGYVDRLLRLIPPAAEGAPWTWEAAPDWAPESSPHSLLRAADGTLWWVQYNGVSHYDDKTGGRATFDSNNGIPGDQYFDLVQDSDGTLWLTTDTALVHYDGRRWTPYLTPNEMPDNAVRAMAEGSDGTLWFIADSGPLFTYSGGKWDQLDYLNGTMFDLALQGDVAWIANENGLIRWENGVSRLYTTEDGLNDNFVTAVELDPKNPDTLWIGTNSGLNALNTANDTFQSWTQQKDGLPGSQVAMLKFDAQGVLWIGLGYDTSQPGSGEPALVSMSNGTLTTVAKWGAPLTQDYDDRVQAVAFDPDGSLWMATNAAVYLLKGERWQHFTESAGAPEYKNIQDMLWVNDSLLIVTSYYGMYRYNATSRWQPLGYAHTGGGYEFRLYRTKDGALWVLTETGLTRIVGDPAAVQ